MQADGKKDQILETIEDGFFTLDRKWSFNYINRKAANIVGMEPEELVGKVIWEVSPEICGTNLEKVYRQAMELQVAQRIEMKGLLTGRWYNIIAFPSAEGISVYWQDITGQKQAEMDQQRQKQELEQREAEYLNVLDSAIDGSWVVDCVNGTIQCSEQWARRIGLDQIPEKDRLPYTRTLIHPDDKMNANNIYNCFESRKDRFDLEYRVKTIDKGYIWTQNRGKIAYDETGNPLRVYAVTFDITERKEDELNLLKKEQEYLEIIDSSSEGSFIRDLNMDEIYFSKEWLKRLGIGHLSPQEAALAIDSLVHPDDVAGIRSEFLHSCRQKNPKIKMEFRIRTVDSGYIWVLGQGKIIYNQEGKPVKYFGTHMDITERKKMEEALRESEEKYRKIVTTANEGIAMVDAQNKIIFVNQVLAKLTGYSVDEMVGRNSSSFIVEEESEKSIPRFENLRDGINDRYELMARKKDGGYLWFIVSGSSLRDKEGNYMGSLAMFTDITERKQMEIELKESRDKYQALIETNVDFIWEMDAMGRYTYCSPQMEKLWGLNPVDMIGKTPFDLMPPEVRECVLEEFIKNSNSSSGMRGLETTSYDGQGNLIFIETSGVPFFDEGGLFLGYRGVTRDITERKKAEEAIKKSEEQLWAYVTASSDMIYCMNPDWSEMHQLDGKGVLSNTECPDENWLQKYIDPEDQPQVAEVINKAIREKSIFELEHRVLHADGSLGWTFSRAVPLLNAEGEIVEWIGAAKDITARKQIESALAENEKQYRELVKYAPAGIYEVDFRSKRFLSVNDAMCQFTGYSREELLEMTPFDLLDAQSQITFQTRISQWLSGEEPDQNVDYKVKTKKGQEIYTSLNVSFNRDENGKPLGATVIAHDITERKQAEEEVKKANDQLSKRNQEISNERRRLLGVLESLPVTICLISPDYHIVFANRAFREMFGELDDRHCYEFCCGYTEPCSFCEAFVPLKTGQMHHWEFVHPKSSTILDVYNLPFSDTDGLPLILEMDFDITERKKLDKALYERTYELEEANHQKKDVLESISDCFYALDKDLRFTYVNKAAEEIWSLSRDELLGRNIGEVFSGLIETSLSKFHQVLEEQIPQHYQVFSKVIERWGTMSVYPTKEGVSVYFRDITEQKLAEEALRESERVHAFQSAILESVRDPLWATDSGLRIMYWNDAATATFGWTADEVQGRHIGELFRTLVPGSTRDDAVAQLLQTGDYRGETVCHCKDGRPILAEASSRVVRGSDGEVVRVVSTARDITDRKRAEEALKKSEEKARALVMELEKADKNKNTFLNMLSHELRNPLASIMMSLSLLDRVPSNGEQALRAREIAIRQGEQLTRLVDDLLDVTRITQNKIILKKENIELNQLVQKAAADYQGHFIEKSVALEIKLTPALIYLEADPARLTQIISNLLHNATKFTAKGDKTLVTVSKDKKTSEAVIIIQDTGIGIKPELLSELFEPFVQEDSSLARTHGGLGLGLAIVKGMVELHGGSVTAHSEGLGCGTQFNIRLPIISSDEEKQEDNRKGITARSFKILVIDDIPDIAEILSSLLSYLGHEVVIAISGLEGIAKAKEFRPEVVICDIGLPGMNGYEVAKNLRNDKELKDTFLIALSGYAQPEDLEQSGEAGFNTHLAKPVNLDTLEQVLAEVLFY